jgi:hypothetical protein
MDAGQQFREDQDNKKLSQLTSLHWNSIADAERATDNAPDSNITAINRAASDPNSSLATTLRIHRKALHEASPEAAGRYLSTIVDDYWGTYGHVPGLQEHHLNHYMSHPGITDNHLIDHVLSAGASGSGKELLMNHPRVAGNTNLKALIALSGGR